MGSTGSGRFSDYSGTKAQSNSGDGTGVSGGESGVDKCKQSFNVLLEDVGSCDFYSEFMAVPDVGEQLGILFDKRVFAVNVDGVKVGALPTAYNYLVACLEAGITYVGRVDSSDASPVPTVAADFVPQ